MIVLSARDVSVRIGSQTILDRVALPDIAAGQIVGVIGPNGSGKSTLLRALAFKDRAVGHVTISGGNGAQGRHVYMPQGLPLPSPLRAYELLVSHARALGERSATRSIHNRISILFEKLGLSDLALRPMSELSGGQRQLIGYALAISRQPDLLLLDEPTSALDIRWQLRLLDDIRSYVRDHQAACIAALHDIDLAARACDRLILLSEGRSVASGAPDAVLTPDNLAAVYGVRTHLYERSDGALGIEILGSHSEGGERHA